MPVKKEDAERALNLLKNYRSGIHPSDRSKIQSVDRVITIFNSELFRSLIDIQEFYEATLLDQQLSTHQKTQATLRVAEKYASMDDMQPVGNGLAAADDDFPPRPLPIRIISTLRK
ncbi:hypothetical protein EB796_010356 [Bugula neritina]|uniref:L27 domain-containing protein n=1 Tax=Bugula neritina TaxID=10212 RepID=A0A7J7K170_BUGNE|nr:hypothetical protein EB796_010356 [Bugula neritina]